MEPSFNYSGNLEVDLNDPKLLKELKEAGWEESEEEEFDESELEQELEKQLQGVHAKFKFTENIEETQLNEEDLEDPDLAAELSELGGAPEPPREEQLTQQIESCKQQALECKKQGSIEEAKEWLRKYKSLQLELQSLQKEKKVLEIARSRKQEEPEEFDYDSIVSMSVLEYEKEQAQRNKNQDLVEKLDMAIDLLTANINSGIISQEQYVASLHKKIQEHQLKPTKKTAKHVQLMQQELEEDEEDEEDEETLEQPQDQTLSIHEHLMQTNFRYRKHYEVFEELKEAFNYLKGIGARERCEKVLQKTEKVHRNIEEFKSGNQPSEEFLPLTPEDITGMSEAQRKQSIAKLQKFCLQKAAEAKEKALEALKTKDTDSAKVFKKEMLDYEKQAKQLEESMQNPWQIPPKVGVKSALRAVAAINEEVPEGVLEVYFGKCEGLKDSEQYFVEYSLTGASDKVYKGRTTAVKKLNQKGFKEFLRVQLDPKTYSSLYRRRMNFEVFESHTIRSNKSKAKATIKLEQLGNTCSYQLTVPFSRKGPNLELVLKVRKAFVKNEVKQVTENVEYVESLVPAFKELEKQQSKQPEKKSKEDSKEEVNPRNFSKQELEDPNCIENLNSYEVLEAQIENLKQAIIACRSNGKDPGSLLNKQREVMKKMSIIETQTENGMITPEQYKEVLNNQIQHDVELAKYFKQQKQQAKLQVVVNRVKTMKKELAELS